MTEEQLQAEYVSLGRLVWHGRAVENVAYLIARAVGEPDPEAFPVSRVLRATRKRAKAGLPPWARDVQLDDVTTWIRTAEVVLDNRNRHVHWHRFQRAEAEGWVPYHRSDRTGEMRAYETADADTWAEHARQASQLGNELLHKLLFEVREGIYHWHPRLARPGEEWVPYAVYTNGAWPQRPTSDELDAWYARLVNEAPAEWSEWVEKILAERQPARTREQAAGAPRVGRSSTVIGIDRPDDRSL
ncbi:hypothetical protein [Jatrophihabitans sp.]|uniref:hypothetical protein n=1 Tax=Jatrophihabitans sp. TaxID=1932789 RepID=UPI002B598FA9|nr:hypothetical protein [Jatrophihabitans sp.]